MLSGSFGHFQASKSGVHKGQLNKPLVKGGFVATRISVSNHLQLCKTSLQLWFGACKHICSILTVISLHLAPGGYCISKLKLMQISLGPEFRDETLICSIWNLVYYEYICGVYHCQILSIHIVHSRHIYLV